jgi:hypothetical protein
MNKTCKTCGLVLPLESFPIGKGNSGGRRPHCKPCHSKHTYATSNPEVRARASAKYHRTPRGQQKSKAAAIRNAPKRNECTRAWRERKRADGTLHLLHQKYLYGLSDEGFDALCARDPICAICKLPKRLVTDHNHTTNKVRGRLCNNCNTALGKFGDGPELLIRALEYLKERDGAHIRQF